MRRKTPLILALALTGAATQVGSASATDVTVTAPVSGTTLGSRTLTVPSALALAVSSGQSTLSGSLVTTVTEAAKVGANPWYVTADATDFANGAATIVKSNLATGTASPANVGGGGTITYAASGTDFGSTVTLVSDAQDVNTVYTGTYATTTPLSLAVPNGSPTGNYTATLTVTLVG